MTPSDDSAAPRRSRGARAGLDRDRIIAAARTLDPDAVTMQAVADILGVDRKALNYHVRDRESLLELLAVDAILTHFTAISVAPSSDWREACRAWAVGMYDSVLATGALVGNVRFTTQWQLSAVGPAEVVLEKLLAAGFELETAARGMHLLNTISIGIARDIVQNKREGGHPQIAELRRALGGNAGEFSAIESIVHRGIDTYDEAQFDFELAAFFAYMEALLAG